MGKVVEKIRFCFPEKTNNKLKQIFKYNQEVKNPFELKILL